MKIQLCSSSAFYSAFVDIPKNLKILHTTHIKGWNWNKFGCYINEELLKGNADAMGANGMKDAGYEYIIIDDCWQNYRDENGFIHANKKIL